MRYWCIVCKEPATKTILDGNHTTCSLHLYILRQGERQDYYIVGNKYVNDIYSLGLRQAHSSWHLELRLVQKGHRRRRLDGLNNCGCYSSQVRTHTLNVSYVSDCPYVQHCSSAEGNHRGIELSGSVIVMRSSTFVHNMSMVTRSIYLLHSEVTFLSHNLQFSSWDTPAIRL